MDPRLFAAIAQNNGSGAAFLYKPGFVTGQGFTATRADATTCARYRDSSGIWQVVAANVLRDAHYHYDGTQNVVTLLREGASTNSALGSCSFADGTYWGGNTDFTIAAVTSCIAGQTAYKHTDAAGGANRRAIIGTFVNAQTDCISVIFENVDAVTSRLNFYDETAGATMAIADLTWATGTVASAGGAGSVGVIPLGTGPNGGAMYRLWVNGTGAAAGTGGAGNQRRVFIQPTLTAGKIAIIHHAQFEAATSYPSSPIVTVASAVTRAVDLVRVSYPYAPQGATILLDAYDLMSGNSTVVGLGIGPSPMGVKSVEILRASGKWKTTYTNAAAATSTSTAAAGPSYGDRVELRAFLTVSGSNVTATLGQSINSGTEAVAAAGTARAIDAAFGGPPTYLTMGYEEASAYHANLAIRSLAIVLGSEQTMATMRFYAGT